MKVVTTRVEEKDIKDLALIGRAEKAERAEVVRKMLARGIRDWKMEVALKKLRRREVSIAKAAEIGGMSFADMLDLAAKESIDIGYSPEDLEKDFAKLKK